MVDNNLKVNNDYFLHSTDTINGIDLWNNSAFRKNLIIRNNYITQKDNTQDGVIFSKSFFLEPFTELVPSWNVLTKGLAIITILISIGNREGYSDYYTMGIWGQNGKFSVGNQEDDFAKVFIDTIRTKKHELDRIKFKIIFGKSQSKSVLKNISIATVKQSSLKNYDTSCLNEKEIQVTPRQQLSIPTCGRVICSPTSLSMVLNYHHYNHTPEIIAEKVYDNERNIYGNWSFNASYAGEIVNMVSRVEYTRDLSVLMNYINNDIPLILSIKTNSKELLVGSIMPYPSGHLVVLTGFKKKDTQWVAIVNDPAEYQDDLVRREYKLNQLLEAWRGYFYMIRKI
jgi:hypothetical protein